MWLLLPLLSVISFGSSAVAPTQQNADGSVRVVEPKVPGLKKVTHVTPIYPEQARLARIQGLVSVVITVGADGRVSDARLERTIPMAGQAVLDAVKQWVYDPATVKAPLTLRVSVLFSATTTSDAGLSPQTEGTTRPESQDAGETAGAATAKLTTLRGFTVDVPATWKQYESGGSQHAVSSDGHRRVAIADDSGGSLLKIVAASEAHLQSIPHGNGRILYRHLGQPGGYVIYVQLNDAVTMMSCYEGTGAEGGPASCLSIAKTARFVKLAPK